jgi:hypothetical protein
MNKMIHVDDVFDVAMKDLEQVVLRRDRINTIIHGILVRTGYETRLKEGWEWGWFCSDSVPLYERLTLSRYETHPCGGQTEKECIVIPVRGEPEILELDILFDIDRKQDVGGAIWETFVAFTKKHKTAVQRILSS